MHLINRYFHSFLHNGTINWKGQVLSIQEDGSYLVQLFNWADGKSNHQEIVKREDMSSWIFYRERF